MTFEATTYINTFNFNNVQMLYQQNLNLKTLFCSVNPRLRYHSLTHTRTHTHTHTHTHTPRRGVFIAKRRGVERGVFLVARWGPEGGDGGWRARCWVLIARLFTMTLNIITSTPLCPCMTVCVSSLRSEHDTPSDESRH